jgi:hypothetical protein
MMDLHINKINLILKIIVRKIKSYTFMVQNTDEIKKEGRKNIQEFLLLNFPLPLPL